MLYVKVDAAGNPTEEAKNYKQLRFEHQKRNSVLPSQIVFERKFADLGYAEVPLSEAPDPQSGKKVVPDVPVKQNDGTMKRTWKQVDAENVEEMDSIMRNRRNYFLTKYADTISPLRWENFSEAEKEEVRNWHKSLLDMPQSTGWPYVAMPPVPNILAR